MPEHSDTNAGLALVTEQILSVYAVQRPKPEILSDWYLSLEYMKKKQMADPVISVLRKWIESVYRPPSLRKESLRPEVLEVECIPAAP